MTNQDYTHIVLVVDRSGSMHGIDDDMNGGIVTMMEEQAKNPGKVLVDAVRFDDRIDVVHEGVGPSEVRHDLVEPRGSTALNDALGMAITRTGHKLSLMSEDDRPGNVLVVVVTDGMENASREYTTDQIKAMVEEQTEKWGWTFSFLAANIDAFAVGAGYGFHPAQTIAFAASAGGTQNVWAAASANATRVSKGNNSGYLPSERDAAVEN